MIRFALPLIVILALAAVFLGPCAGPTELPPRAPDDVTRGEPEAPTPVLPAPDPEAGGDAHARPTELDELRTPFRGRVSGRVVNPSGKPIRGVQVGIGPKRLHAVITGSRGEFTVRNFTPGKPFRLFASATGFGWAGSVTLNLRAGEVRDGVSITMFKRATISGRVFDAKGDCVVGAKVQLSWRTPSGWRSMASVRTDERGVYRVREAPPGQIRLQVFFDGWPARHAEVAMDTAGGEDFTDVEIRLQPEFEIRGTVRAPDGRPLRRILVRADDGEGRSRGTVSVDDGTFSLRGLSEKAVAVGAVWRSGRPRSPRVTVHGGAEGVELVAATAGRIRGRLRPPRGRGVMSITVDLITPGPGPVRLERSAVGRDDTFVLGDLEPGTWRLSVRYSSVTSEPVEVRVAGDGATTDIGIDLLRSTAFLGRVVRSDGTPAASPTVTLRGDRMLDRAMKGKPNGHFQFRNLLRGAHVLTVVAGDAPPREYAVNVPGDVTIRLPAE